ncbi:acetoacetate-CoA ligase [Dendrothele bispora CBS 962.96]|uniref:Acetoacetate-CoA ligase n=1 Tax=Dendrothele bispora (strain CBS 962.96) TaxID=1314807 RepID=A0A4S8LSH2_DENBC|nr:acetoacetate-CoA ligase [Dendrothele bispora CBS 962.96]
MSNSGLFQHSHLVRKADRPNWSTIDTFRARVNRKHRLNLKDYDDLHRYSVEKDTFWLDLWEHLNIVYSVPPNAVTAPSQIPEVPIWFPGARLNWAENILQRNDDGIACTATGESNFITDYSFKQLRGMVREMAAAMRVQGVGIGDRIAAIVRNSILAVVINLAAASIGAIFSTTSADMGAQGILDRYKQIKPKLVFCETEVQYAGRVLNVENKVKSIIQELFSHCGLEKAIFLPSAVSGKESDLVREDGKRMQNVMTLKAFLASGDGRELVFEQLPFDHPLCILYSSGTSGPPKCILHTAGGVLINCKKDFHFGRDMRYGDTLFYYTTTSWMVFTAMLQVMSLGGRIILYDGSPFYPNIERFVKLISDVGSTVFGTSPRFISELQGRDIKPLELASFETLKTLTITGAIVSAPVHTWAQQAFGEHVYVHAPAGGTDVCCTFVGGARILPTHAGEIPAKTLGMKVEVFDSQGRNIEHTGEPGEMVCTRPHPSLPRLWGDTPDGKKLRETYFSMYPGVWRQGDFIVVNPKTKGMIILGRSDGVLNPSGIRFGTSEIYNVLEQVRFSSRIDDSLCVGQRRSQDSNERVLLFVRMRSGKKFGEPLVKEIKDAIRTSLSPRHVPEHIFEVEDIPYTVNGKKVEIAVKQIVSGTTMKPSGTVANPESLNLYYKYRDLEKIVGTTTGQKAKAKL